MAEYQGPNDNLLVRRWRKEFNSWIGDGILSYIETLDRIREDRLSFARFGDGEMRLAANGSFDLAFQENSVSLRKDLDRVLLNTGENLLVGMSPFWRNDHWGKVFVEVWPHLREIVPQEPRTYGAAYVTRSAAFHSEKTALVDAWRGVWDSRDIVTVCGRRSRFELVPELFDNVRSVDHLYSEPVNAYSDIDRLVAELKAEEGKLVLASLGAAATVLCSRLSELGVQAIDIGHISNCYLNVFKGGPVPEKLPRIAPEG